MKNKSYYARTNQYHAGKNIRTIRRLSFEPRRKTKNVYLFAKENNFEEKEFYHYFSGFDEIEREMLNHLFTKSLELVSEVNSPSEVTTREKLLNVYYIFFENLTMNRSLVLSILGTIKFRTSKRFRIFGKLTSNLLTL